LEIIAVDLNSLTSPDEAFPGREKVCLLEDKNHRQYISKKEMEFA
jgi:hypothetical protein